MSMIPLAAPLFRRVIADETYAEDLRNALDDKTFDQLVNGQTEISDLRWMSPSEWQWFANWRQALGGGLDRTLLEHISRSAATRFARFELHTLVLRDVQTNAFLERSFNIGHQEESEFHLGRLGVDWLATEAAGTTRPIELANDALQSATEAAWFVIRQLTSLDDDRARLVRARLSVLVRAFDIAPEVRRQWGSFG